MAVDILPPVVVEKWAKARRARVSSAPRVMALIDTGASVTGVDVEVLNRLQYPPIGVANLSTPSGPTQTQVYMIRLIIPSRADPNFPSALPRITLDNVRVIAVKLKDQPYKVLLGRDVLSKMVLIYNGPQALVTLNY